ncbi:MAG: pal [Alphaproteobacteria bacterium]|jgi:peptidoglycan-associated lipoprotein|nr:pal [Alphaproteobacteria bacterium]
MMRVKILGLLAAVLLVAACETTPPPNTAATSATQPGRAAPGTAADFQQNVGDRVFFDYDSFQLTAEARQILTRQSAWLKQYGTYRVTVEGHADERGTREYNLALGERRAASVRAFLVSQGIPANRVATISYGKERPAEAGSTEQAYARNRRGVSVLSN